MYPGQTTRLSSETRASAATMTADKDVLFLTGTTTIVTINPKSMNKAGQAQLLYLVPTAGNVAMTAAGNVAVAQTMTTLTVTTLVWNPATSKWYPSAIA